MSTIRSDMRRVVPSLAVAGAAALALVVVASPMAPAYAGEPNFTPIRAPLVAVDWQSPLSIPPRFRNHCGFDAFGRFYCANHCGADYAFYYCSPASFGCCHPGKGYCGWDGALRCAP